MEVRELLTKYDFPGDDVPIIRGNAKGALDHPADPKFNKCIGDLMDALERRYIPDPVRIADKPFLMAIEDVFSIEGRGTVVTGRIEQGRVKVGEKVELIGLKDTAETTCTGVEMFNKTLNEGIAGDNVGILLRGTKKDDVERGQVLAHPKSITPHTKFQGEVYVLSKEEGGRHTPFFSGYRPQFYFRTTDVTGSTALFMGARKCACRATTSCGSRTLSSRKADRTRRGQPVSPSVREARRSVQAWSPRSLPESRAARARPAGPGRRAKLLLRPAFSR